MYTEQKKPALSPSDWLRLQRLAARASVTPEQMLPFVLRDGFDECEESVNADLEADAYFKLHPGIPHDEVMADAARLIASYAERKRQSD